MGRDETLTIDDVINKAKWYLEKDDTMFQHLDYELADKAQPGQYRKSGELYIIHPVQVAGILVDLQMDPETIASGFLHDVVEDIDVTLDELEEVFNREV